MALRTYNPKTPGTRQLVLVDRSTLYKGKPVKALTEGKNQTGGRNGNGRITVRFRGGGHKQAYRIDRLQAHQARHAGDGRADRIRSEPHGVHCADQVQGRRAGLHPRAAAARRRRHRDRRRPCRREAGQCDAARQHAGRQHRPQRRIEDRQGRAAGAFGRHLRADRRSRPGIRDHSPEFGRAASGARPLHRHHRCGVEPRSHEHLDRQGRPQPLARQEAA